MSGPEFVAELHARMPSLPLLVLENGYGKLSGIEASGVCYAAQDIAAEELLTLANRFLADHKTTVA
jgi:hypothetical protein